MRRHLQQEPQLHAIAAAWKLTFRSEGQCRGEGFGRPRGATPAVLSRPYRRLTAKASEARLG
jgi:hypothetical protein